MANVMARGGCTINHSQRLVKVKHDAMDKWKLLSDAEVTNFANGLGKSMTHNGAKGYPHICAAQGTWGFGLEEDPEKGSLCLHDTVAFLYYKMPEKLKEMMGNDDNGKQYLVSGATLLRHYTQAKTAHLSPRVWQRETQGEICFNFCVKFDNT